MFVSKNSFIFESITEEYRRVWKINIDNIKSVLTVPH